MAAGTKNDFVIYDDQFQEGVIEGLTQVTDAFNAASANAIQLMAASLTGDYAKKAFFKALSAGGVARRDITSTSSVTSNKLEQGELISVKINRRFGPLENTLDSFRKIAKDPGEFSFILGEMFGQHKAEDMLNTGVLAAEAALAAQSAVNYDATGETVKTMTTAYLQQGLNKLGDRASRVKCFVMHSKAYNDLTLEQMAGSITNVADRVIYGATPGTLNRPVVISDIPALTDANGSLTDTYNTLGLVEGGLVLTESEEQEMLVETSTGKENLTVTLQGEYAYNIELKGMQWDTTNGGINPTDGTVGTGSNWDKVVGNDKDLPGVRILTQ